MSWECSFENEKCGWVQKQIHSMKPNWKRQAALHRTKGLFAQGCT